MLHLSELKFPDHLRHMSDACECLAQQYGLVKSLHFHTYDSSERFEFQVEALARELGVNLAVVTKSKAKTVSIIRAETPVCVCMCLCVCVRVCICTYI